MIVFYSFRDPLYPQNITTQHLIITTVKFVSICICLCISERTLILHVILSEVALSWLWRKGCKTPFHLFNR